VVAFFAISCSGGGAQKPEQTPTGGFDPALVIKLYSAKCGICHGADGAMQNAGAKNLTTSVLARDQVISLISNGIGTMPPHKDVLSADQIAALADYSITLRKP